MTIESVYEKFIHRKPRCFQCFEIEDAKDIVSSWVTGSEFLSKIVKCSCGNYELNIYASYGKRMNLAPILLECTECQITKEIFNPTIHGWDGENGDNYSLIGESKPKIINKKPCRIVAEYSFQGAENYEDLIEEIENPEDYFDVFAIYTVEPSGKLSEVVAYECA